MTRKLTEGAHLTGVVYDVGKLQVPAALPNRHAKLSEPVKEYAGAGWQMLKHIKIPWPVAKSMLQRHDRHGGSGYPDRLKGEQIILQTRILAVADIVAAISACRPYRPVSGIEAASNVISAGQGSKFDVAAVDACMTLIQERDYDPQN